jgi:hypothetical protein
VIKSHVEWRVGLSYDRIGRLKKKRTTAAQATVFVLLITVQYIEVTQNNSSSQQLVDIFIK